MSQDILKSFWNHSFLNCTPCGIILRFICIALKLCKFINLILFHFYIKLTNGEENFLAYYYNFFSHTVIFSIDIFVTSFIIIIYFNCRLITILWCLLPYIDMNQPWVYMCPHPEPPSHFPPPHPIPLGCPSALAWSALLYALNLDWSSISHTVIYMFQC